MRVVPSSPRVRRRLARLGIGLGAAGVVATIVVLIPDHKPANTAPPKNAPRAQLIKQSTYVSSSDRRAINATLDRFIPAALNRSSPKTAWELSGPDLTGGSTLRQRRHGTSPIPYYPARGKRFHSWTTIDAGPDYVDFNLLVHPKRGAKESSWVFSGQMLKRHGRWLVNGLYTIAIMARPSKSGRHEVGPADFAAGPAAQSGENGAPPPTGRGALGKTWLLVAGGVIVLALLFPLGFGVVSVLRSRRARRLYARSAHEALPPLPQRIRSSSETAGGGGVGGPRH
jgi:hypothetical protein